MTLKKKHIFIENKFIKIDFIGKKNVRNVAICKNKEIYNFFFDRLKISEASKFSLIILTLPLFKFTALVLN